MPTFRRPKDHEHPYAQIANEILDDGDLSFKAKGILSYLLARSDDWDIYQSQLAKIGPDGKTAVRSGIKELREVGYLQRNKLRDEDGTFSGYEYIVYEEPSSPGITETGNTEIGKPEIGEAPATNKDNTNTDSTNKESTSGGTRSAPARGESKTEEGVDWSFLGERGQRFLPDIKSNYEELQEGRTDVLQLAYRHLTRQGRTVPKGTVNEHATQYPAKKVVAAYVIAGIQADGSPASYADTILKEGFSRNDSRDADDGSSPDGRGGWWPGDDPDW